MGLRETDVPSPTHAPSRRRLGHRAFHSRALGIDGLKGSGLLTLSGFYDVALRDFGLMLAALTLARLSSVYDRPGIC